MDMDEFSLLEVLSDMSGIKIPGPLVGIKDKKVIHNKSCTIEAMKDEVTSILALI